MISLNNRLNSRKQKYKNKNIDIIEGINKLQNSVLTKACVLKGIVKDRSIGPLSNYSEGDSDYIESSPTGSFVTSTPDQSINEFFDNNEETYADSMLPSVIVTAEKSSTNGTLQPKNVTPKAVTNKNDLPNTSLREMLYNKRLQEFDEDRRDQINGQINRRVQQIVVKEKEILKDICETKHDLQLARTHLEIERAQKLLRVEEDLATEAQQMMFANEQRCNQRLNEANERIKKALLKQQELEEQHKQLLKQKKQRLDKILEFQIQYRSIYQQLQEVTRSCKSRKDLIQSCTNETMKLKAINGKFESLVESCKSGHVSEQNLSDGQEIISHMDEIINVFRKEAAAINIRFENAEKLDEEKKRVEEPNVKETVNQNVIKETEVQTIKSHDLSQTIICDSVDKESFANHLKLKTFLDEFEESLQPLLKDDSSKKFRFACQRAVNIPVNAISPYSKEHMLDKFSRLYKLLKGQPVLGQNANVSASSHPLGIKFCTNLLAKKFVSQGEHTVSSKPEAAFAIAGIIVSLWIEFPEFGKLLLGHFQRECPYLIPAFMPQVEGQSNEDYYRILGYRYIDGKIETQDKFLKRMTGVMRLYAAIIITQQNPRTVPHPLGLREAWRWLSASLNLEPRPDITATLIFDMLEVAGSELMVTYNVQFKKMLHLLCIEYLSQIEKMTPDGCGGGPVGRLRTFLEKILKEGIAPPVGVLTKNIW